MNPVHIAGAITTVQEAFYRELVSLPEEFASWHPTPGEWCAKEVLGHIIESERTGFAGRVKEILAAENQALKATGPLSPGYCERPLLPLLDEFRRQREASVALVKGLAEEDLERAGMHERVGRLTVNDLLHEWVHHDRAHLKQLLDNVQKYVWPAMGGAQRFSQPSQ